jgi:alpha,alpha-trehalase
MIGNGRVIALVSPTSAIEWLCLPSFDSPSVFARLLDRREGGTFRVLAGGGREIAGELQYLPNTNVTATRFEAGDCAWQVTDFAPRIPEGLGVAVPREIVRLVRPERGQPRLAVDFDPRPCYARVQPTFQETSTGLEVLGGAAPLHLTSNLPVPYILKRREFTLDRPIFFVLSYGSPREPSTLASVEHDLNLTAAGWRAWARTCALPSFAAGSVLRSALCLKLHAFHDTGAVIASATTSIPEALGTPRTWDYRYCWLRDAAFVVEALRRLGHNWEGQQFISYLRDVAEAGPLQPVYGIDGERHLPEQFLDHLAGFGDNGFVRIGNAAAEQRQNDLMGEIILCLDTQLSDLRALHPDPGSFWPLVRRLVGEAIEAAPEPDMGIWEFRSILRPYTFSRAMCWAAIYHGARLAERLGFPAQAAEWDQVAAGERQLILERGFNSRLGYFTQSLDGDHPDAANLLLPAFGFIEASDPRFVSTLRAYERLLVDRGWMLRYRNPDDFGQTTSAFSICSFWWAEALALAGEIDRARELFDRLLSYANPVGLFSDLRPGRRQPEAPQCGSGARRASPWRRPSSCPCSWVGRRRLPWPPCRRRG